MQNNEQHYALIKNSVVQNIIVADDSFIEVIKNEYDDIIYLNELYSKGEIVGIGWEFVDSKFIPPVVQVPTEVSGE